MVSSDNLCMGCMREIGPEKKCPHCGYYADSQQALPYLPVRAVIANRYLTGRVLETNSEGATYIGWDLKEKKAVNIREFLPDAFTTRTQANLNLQVLLGSEATYAELRRSFEELWCKLVKLSGLSALIKVNDVVEDYGTSYAIYDYFDGISLRDFLLRSKTGYIPWEKARQLLMPTLSTLGTLHSNGIIHRGISPTTLVIGEDGKIKITGFCIGEARSAASRLTPQIYEGYAAVEQYGFDARQGSWTDIYAFAAVLYRTLIGSDPIPSKERMTNDRLMVPGKFAEALPAYVINGLINALQILPQDRTKSVEQLRAELSATPSATAAGVTYGRKPAPAPGLPPKVSQAPVRQAPAKKKKKQASAGSIVLLSALIAVLVGLIAFGILALTVFKDRIRMPGDRSQTAVTQIGEPVQVPQFEGKYYDDVKASPVFTMNFVITKKEEYSSNVAKGYIISQSITAETEVPSGTEIVLTVSLGEEKNMLPNVIGEQYGTALNKLTELGFVVETEEVSTGSYEENEIIDMSLVPEKVYPKGTQVTLKVYSSEASSENESNMYSTTRNYYNYSTTEREESTSSYYPQTETYDWAGTTSSYSTGESYNANASDYQ